MYKGEKTPESLIFAESRGSEHLNDCEVVASMEITKETLFVKKIEIEGRRGTILYNKNKSPKLIFERSSHLINKLDYCRSYPNRVLVDVFSDMLKMRGYCKPYLSHKGLFAPSGAPSKEDCSWFDVMEIVRIDTFKSSSYSGNETLCIFSDGLQVVFPKGKSEFKKKLIKDLTLYLAYIIYEREIHRSEGKIFYDRSNAIRELHLKLIGKACAEYLMMDIEQVTANLNIGAYFQNMNKSGRCTTKKFEQTPKIYET